MQDVFDFTKAIEENRKMFAEVEATKAKLHLSDDQEDLHGNEVKFVNLKYSAKKNRISSC